MHNVTWGIQWHGPMGALCAFITAEASSYTLLKRFHPDSKNKSFLLIRTYSFAAGLCTNLAFCSDWEPQEKAPMPLLGQWCQANPVVARPWRTLWFCFLLNCWRSNKKISVAYWQDTSVLSAENFRSDKLTLAWQKKKKKKHQKFTALTTARCWRCASTSCQRLLELFRACVVTLHSCDWRLSAKNWFINEGGDAFTEKGNCQLDVAC